MGKQRLRENSNLPRVLCPEMHGIELGLLNLSVALSAVLRDPDSGLWGCLVGAGEEGTVYVPIGHPLSVTGCSRPHWGRGEGRFLLMDINRASRPCSELFGSPRGPNGPAFPREGPCTPARLGEGNHLLEVRRGSVGRRRGRLSCLVTQTWGPHPQCEVWHMHHPHLMGGAVRFNEPIFEVPGK